MKIKFSSPLRLVAFTMLILLSTTNAAAQKKLVAVTQSALSGISLPEGSKHDGRFLMELSGKTLLELETKKVNTTVTKTEILYLPTTAKPEEIVEKFTTAGWNIISADGDDKFVWLQKDNRYIITYFSIGKKQHELYFGEVANAPTTTINSNSNIQPIQQNNSQQQTSTQQQADTQQYQQTNQQQNEQQQTNQQQAVQISNASVKQNGFAFTTTNFDDGWTSTVQEDWVEVTKANIKVLIHYPNKKADAYNSVLMDGLKNAWNILIAPRYSSAANMEFKPLTGWQSIEFAEANMVEKGTNKTVHVVLFKMNYSNGSGTYLEFITPDKNVFEKEFGAYHQTTYGWEKMEAMANYNKFAVAASDLTGKWTNDFSGMTQYVNAYTGRDAGANTHASNESFEFGAGNSYKWDLGVASGFVGNIKFQSAKATGKLTMVNNWQVKFSDIEGKPKTYNVQFVCIKGARVLWIGETGFGKKD